MVLDCFWTVLDIDHHPIAVAWVPPSAQDVTDAWFGKASDRYDKLRARSFLEVEAAELLHSLSFQREMESTGADSKRRPGKVG